MSGPLGPDIVMVSTTSSERFLHEAALIGGEWVTASGRIRVQNPATGDTVGFIPDLGAPETNRAIAAASDAFRSWRAQPAARRAALLEAWHDALVANTEPLARLMTMEQGKPLAEARGEVAYGAGFIRWFAEEARRVYGDTIPAPTADRRIVVLKEPIGVAAVITPWNFPNAMIARKAGAALAAGCTLVVKPSELTPFSALAMAALAADAGIPPGVINVITGQPAAIGEALTSNPLVRKLSFTGSTRVGKLLMQQSAATLKRVTLELGGNAPFIIFDDADVETAVAGVVASKFRNAGQTCVSANRILVQDGIHDAFAARLAAATGKLMVGNGLDEGVTIGPLINDAAVEKVLGHIDDAQTRGAVAILGGGGRPHGGRFVTPTVLTGATPAMRLANEETFGPVAPLFRFSSEDEAVALANATPYGLASYFYTENVRRAWRVADKLEFGMVGLNTGSVSMEMAPFGGIKESGFGREGSKYGIEDYLQIKTLHFGSLA